MPAFIVIAYAVALAAALLPGTPPDVGAAGNCTTDATLDAEEKKFLTLINNHRAQNGLPPLVASYKLSKAAQWKSTDMGNNGYFAHDDQSRTWVQRIRDCGYGYNTWLGENIAAGVSTAQGAFDLWTNSAGHNANMLSASYRAIGIGRANVPGSPWGWYWTTEFGGVDDGWASAQLPAATPGASPSPSPGPNNGPPTLDVSVRPARNRLVVRANARDADGIDRVEFYVDGQLVTTDRRAPYVAVMRTPRVSKLVVVAVDRRGNASRAEVPVRR